MTARVLAITGPANSGKTERTLLRYRKALAARVPHSTLWLSPTWRAAAAVRDRLVDGGSTGCLSPAVMTFDQFAQAVLQASREPVRPLSPLMKRRLIRLLLDDLLDAGQIKHFLPIAGTGGLVDQVVELIRELKRLDVWPDRFRQACESRGMTGKDAELAAVYAAYQQLLNKHHLYDAEGRFWSARRLLEQGQRRPFDHLRLVVVDGFTDFTPPQHEIIQLLAAWVEELLITLPLEAEPGRADLFSKPLKTLDELRRRHPGLVREETTRRADPAWPALAHLEANLFSSPRDSRPSPDTAGLEIVAASRQLGEIEAIGARIKRLLTAGDDRRAGRPVRPGDVAVVFRSPAEVGVLIREVFGRLGVPFALESKQTLDRSPALAALVGLVRLDVEDWPFRGLLAVLANNYFQPDWPEWREGRAAVAAEQAVRGLQIPRGRTRLLEQLAREADRPTGDDDDQRRTVEKRRRRARAALPLLARLEKLFAALPDRASLDEWADAWHRLARQTGLLGAMDEDRPPADGSSQGPRSRVRGAVPDRAAWEALQGALRTSDKLSRLLRRRPRTLDRAEALAALLDTVRSVTAGGGQDESGRVRVLSAASARALHVPYLFLAGLAEKSFPPPEREDRIYGEAERRRLIEEGLPLVERTERNREEMLLFYEAITRASRRLCFSYPAVDEAAQPLSASPYLAEVDQACGPGRIRRTEVPSLSPIPVGHEPLTAEEFRVKAVSTGLEGNVSLLAGLVAREPEAGLAESLLAGLRMVEARDDRREFGPAEGIFAGAAARRQIAGRYDPSKTVNATELEQYAACPYRFFLERVLRLEPPEDLNLAVDHRARGLLIHGALADFHERVNALGAGPNSPAALEEAEYHRLMAQTLEALSEHAAATPLDAALYEIDLRLWGDWADDYRRQHQGYDRAWHDSGLVLRPTWFEVSFGRSEAGSQPLSTKKPLELSTPGGTVRIAGRIDRIDTGAVGKQAVFNIIDYKTGGKPARFSRDAVAAGTALQLPLYAMAAERLLLADRQAAPWYAGYWQVREKGFQPKQSLAMGRLHDDRLETEPEWEDLRQVVAEIVGALVEGIRDARFPVHSADEECGKFCPFRTICRINQVRSLEKTWQRAPSQA